MNVDHLAKRLVKSGIIDAKTAEKTARKCKNLDTYDLILAFGIGAAVLSVLFVVVANWYRIPYSLKISLHALLNAGVVIALFRIWKTGKRDTAPFKFLMALTSFLILTFIVIVDNIFRLHWGLLKILLFWLFMMLPFWIAFAGNQQKTRKWLLSSVIWCVAFTPKLILKYADKWFGKYLNKYFGKAIPSFDTEKSLPQEKIAAKIRPVLLALCLVWPILGTFSLAAHEHMTRPVRYLMRIPVETFDKLSPMNGDYLRFRFVGPNLPDDKYHDYYIPHGKAEIDKVFSHPEGHKMTMEVHLLEGEVISYDMLYIDSMPWETYLLKERELCTERMGSECQ